MFENNNDDIGRYQIMTSRKQKSLFPTAEDFSETVFADCQLD